MKKAILGLFISFVVFTMTSQAAVSNQINTDRQNTTLNTVSIHKNMREKIVEVNLFGKTEWVAGKTYPISWNFANTDVKAPVKVELFKGNECIGIIAKNQPCSGPNSINGGMYWRVVQNCFSKYLITANNYRIKVTSEKDSSVQGFSKEFTITWPKITITFPQTDEILKRGSAYQITWKCEGDCGRGNIRLCGRHLSPDANAFFIYIAQDIDLSKGAFSWKVPQFSDDVVRENAANNCLVIFIDPTSNVFEMKTSSPSCRIKIK